MTKGQDADAMATATEAIKEKPEPAVASQAAPSDPAPVSETKPAPSPLPPESTPALPDEDSPTSADLLAALRQNEALLMQWLQALHQQMTNVYPWLQSLGGQITGVQQSVAQLQAEMRAHPPAPPQAPQPVAAPASGQAAARSAPAAESGGGFSLEGLATNIGQAFSSVTGSGQAAAPATKASDDSSWEAVFFGRDLASAPQLARERQELVRDLRSGEPEAQALIGLLLFFRGSAAEKMPVLLKDIGEAWYRWRPGSSHGDDPLRQSLIRWLEGQCDSHGANNRIELVRPGDRFDSKKHNAKDPGVEVAEVHGWVVLRDNGKIYTKANVVVR